MSPCPRVSVMIPAFNSAQTVVETIRSVQGQSIADLEVIVVDDGSTDDTAARVEEASATDPRVVFIRQENAGANAARNRALREAKAELVSMIDADDLWHPEKLQRQLTAMDGDRSRVVLCGIRRFSRENGETRWLHETFPPAFPASGPALLDGLITLKGNQMAVLHTGLFWRHQLERVGGWEVGRETAHDWDLWLRLARASSAFCNLDECLYYYRKHSASGTARRPLERSIAVHLATIEREWKAGGLSRRARDKAVLLRHLMIIDDCLQTGRRAEALQAWVGATREAGAMADAEVWRRLARIVRGS